MSNRLAGESSPYLLQHAENPVDWYPWGEEALAKARREDKPIFLSIGYSACHWCHVMAHESFGDPQTAALLNEHFVSIKVDREERPDLDRIYMSAVQALTGQGGWPMSMFLTPEGTPFFGGTYFPPKARYGRASFQDVLRAVSDAWRNRRAEVEQSGEQLLRVLRREVSDVVAATASAGLTAELLVEALHNLHEQYDDQHQGWGAGTKFPQPMAIEFLLRYHVGTGSQEALRMAVGSLEAMARGGLYDQLGGGFHRYSVDDRWLVPHFEKMLYDNAQLARVYLHAWQLTGEPLFRAVATETLDYVLREMTADNGAFYATQDADSEGEEGKFFLWTPDEIRAVLGEGADAFLRAYGVTQAGNFEGKNILHLVGSVQEREELAPQRARLWLARQGRVHPGRDHKVLASWNGLLLAALAEAARVLGREDYRLAAERNAHLLLHAMRDGEGRLYRTWTNGRARLNAYLEDYAAAIDGLLALYQTTFAEEWYIAAQELADVAIAHYRSGGRFYDTADDHETLVVRPRDVQDNATPSGSSMMTLALIELSGLSQDPRYLTVAEEELTAMAGLLARYPLGFGNWLVALDLWLAERYEVAIVGPVGDVQRDALLAVAREGFRPHQRIAVGSWAGARSSVPLLQGRADAEGRAQAYVCRGYLCLPPVTEPQALGELLV